MIPWLAYLTERLEQGDAAILITVAEIKGSAPREDGARMIICAGSSFGTIGGGELEHQAIHAAHQLMSEGACGQVVRKSLGPDLGQCCGGQVTLALEPFAPSDLAWVKALHTRAMKEHGVARRLTISPNGAVSRDLIDPSRVNQKANFVSADEVLLTEIITSDAQPVWIFGAGHVGQALVRALLPLPFNITWIDNRLGAFDDLEFSPPVTVNKLVLAMPELSVGEAPQGAYFLVMTHSHPLDEEIVSAVMSRDDAGYLGLIGSATKRARFLSRLEERGHDSAALERLHCPIGLPELGGKSPAIIAASVAADLCCRVEQGLSNDHHHQQMDQLHVR